MKTRFFFDKQGKTSVYCEPYCWRMLVHAMMDDSWMV